jgi:hypothetical protein
LRLEAESGEQVRFWTTKSSDRAEWLTPQLILLDGFLSGEVFDISRADRSPVLADVARLHVLRALVGINWSASRLSSAFCCQGPLKNMVSFRRLTNIQSPLLPKSNTYQSPIIDNFRSISREIEK